MFFSENFRKIKQMSSVQNTPTLLLFFFFFFFSMCFILGSFFYLDDPSGAPDAVPHRRWTAIPFLRILGSSRRDRLPPFVEAEDLGCDLFDGKWVWDETYPLYNSPNCSFIDDGFRCSQNGRPDDLYTKWRWQPKHCILPRFDANKMLEMIKNRRLIFVGDSIGRNQWESLLCMLSSAIPKNSSIYEVNGNPITKHMGFLAFRFHDFNCTIEYFRAPFLVQHSRKPAGAPDNVKTTLKLDKMDWSSFMWKDADIIVFNTGHWWNIEKTTRGGCYFQEGDTVNMQMTVDEAFQKSIQTMANWVNREVNMNKSLVFFRTYAPVHFRDIVEATTMIDMKQKTGGNDWRNGGTCHMETLPDLGYAQLTNETMPYYKGAVDLLSKHGEGNKRDKKMELLKVTYMSSLRREGHPSVYYTGPGSSPAPLHRQDCSHWCLPGVPDTWNELLHALVLKRWAAPS